MTNRKNVLMIAFHYPPCQMSSGIQRSLKFSQYLAAHDWHPEVLTAHSRAYSRTGDGQIDEIPNTVRVKRAFALDTARHLSIKGNYPLALALPDRWSSWCLGGVVAGFRMIRSKHHDVIWSTYPIATAHLIALILHKLTGIPWVADCRDSMTEDNYPRNRTVRRCYLWLERKVVKYADKVVFTTEGTKKMYATRYPEIDSGKWQVIPNGYDEENFRQAALNAKYHARRKGKSICLVHSGVLYPSERDPTAFFDAVRILKRKIPAIESDLRIILRASGHEALFAKMIRERDIDSIVSLEPAIPYQDAIIEMINSDGLLLFQAANSNHQVPAKLYEYMRSGTPIFALTDMRGDTAATLQEAGISAIVDLMSVSDIHAGLSDFISRIQNGSYLPADPETVAGYSRKEATKSLARLLGDARRNS